MKFMNFDGDWSLVTSQLLFSAKEGENYIKWVEFNVSIDLVNVTG